MQKWKLGLIIVSITLTACQPSSAELLGIDGIHCPEGMDVGCWRGIHAGQTRYDEVEALLRSDNKITNVRQVISEPQVIYPYDKPVAEHKLCWDTQQPLQISACTSSYYIRPDVPIDFISLYLPANKIRLSDLINLLGQPKASAIFIQHMCNGTRDSGMYDGYVVAEIAFEHTIATTTLLGHYDSIVPQEWHLTPDILLTKLDIYAFHGSELGQTKGSIWTAWQSYPIVGPELKTGCTP